MTGRATAAIPAAGASLHVVLASGEGRPYSSRAFSAYARQGGTDSYNDVLRATPCVMQPRIRGTPQPPDDGGVECYAFAGFRLYPARRALMLEGAGVPLGGRAFDLLRVLVEGRERAIGKEELLRRIWPDGVVEANNLTVTMSALRKALGAGSGEKLIQTVAGRGYQFVAPVREEEAEARPHPAQTPSIAVLPFVDMTGDPQKEFFGDGLAEDIIAELSRNRWLTVIARNSSFSYRVSAGASGADSGEVAAVLGVRYVLEGSVRRAGPRIRVTARLVDATTSANVTAVRYDRELADIFTAQDEVTATILSAIRPAIYEAEQERSLRKLPGSVDAWAAYQRGMWHANRFERPNYAEARRWFGRAMELDPGFAPGYYGLGLIVLHDGSGFIAGAEPDWQRRGEALALQAVALDPRDSSGFSVLGLARMVRGEHAGAIEALEAALALNPSDAAAYHTLGATLMFTGRAEEGLEAVRTSLRLSPRDPRIRVRYLHMVLGYIFSDALDAAEAEARDVVRRWPDYPAGWRLLAIVLADRGEAEEAREAIARSSGMQSAPFDDYSHARMPWYGKAAHGRVLRALRRAGWNGPADD